MNSAKMILLSLSISAVFLNSTAIADASNRTPMVDGISGEMIATVAGRPQIAKIAGPTDLEQTTVMMLKPDNHLDVPKLIIVGTKGSQNYILDENQMIDLTLEDQGMYGKESTIKANKSGSLVIKLQNLSVGRNRFETEIIVAYRNNKFVMAGFKREAFDTLNPLGKESCDYNLLTGKGIRNGRSVKVKKLNLEFSKIEDSEIFYTCKGW